MGFIKTGHIQERVSYKNENIYIDKKILPLILWCWEKSIETSYSCEGDDYGPYIAFNSLNDCDLFFKELNKILSRKDVKMIFTWPVYYLLEGKCSCKLTKKDLEIILKYIE